MKPLLAITFQEKFESSPTRFVRAPGRVNIIGEHTDYNEGYVLPMAIDLSVKIALRPRPDMRVVVHSLEYDQTVKFQLDQLQKGKGWAEYIKGSAWAMQEDGWKLSGWDGVMSGDVPRGAGLSSSSAVTVAAIMAFAAASNNSFEATRPDPIKIALLGHKAEDGWVGVHGGIMDQMVCVLSQPGNALFLDCRTLETKQIPLPMGMAVAILDTSTRRGLVDSAYNERRHQCDEAAKILGVRTLRDVDELDFMTHGKALDEITRRRARHVITENGRVLQAVEAMRGGDAESLGRLLNASHVSLRNDFEVSNEALDTMTTLARHYPGCYGARMTGAGFGGCAVALLQQDRGLEFAASIKDEFRQITGLNPTIYICQPATGASITRLTI